MIPTSLLIAAMVVAVTTLSVVAAPMNGDMSSAFSAEAVNKVLMGQVPSEIGTIHLSASSRLARRTLKAPEISSGDVAAGVDAGSDIYGDIGGDFSLLSILLSHPALAKPSPSPTTNSRKQRDFNEARQQLISLLAIAKYSNNVQRRGEAIADSSDFPLGDFNLSSIFRRDGDELAAGSSDFPLSDFNLSSIFRRDGDELAADSNDFPFGNFNLSSIFRRAADELATDNNNILLGDFDLSSIFRRDNGELADSNDISLGNFDLSSIFRRVNDKVVADNSDFSLGD